MNDTLNPPSLAEAINVKGFTGAAGFHDQHAGDFADTRYIMRII